MHRTIETVQRLAGRRHRTEDRRHRTEDRRRWLATAAVVGVAAIGAGAAVLRRRSGQHGAHRPGPLRLRASITVNRSPDEVYARWRDLTRLPEFMTHLREVTVEADGTHSHWTAEAPFGRTVSWEAQLTGDEPGRRISWRSVPGSTVDNSGTVHFAPAPGDRGTEVSVVLHYDVPGGAVGRVVSTLFGEEPEQQVRDDLRRFKQVLETGQLVRSDGLPDGTVAGRRLVQRPARPLTAKQRRKHGLAKSSGRS